VKAIFRTLFGAACVVLASGSLKAQALSPVEPQLTNSTLAIVPYHGIVADRYQHVTPLSAGDKLQLATAVSFSGFAAVTAGISAGITQANNRPASWGQGSHGFARRYGAAFTDQVIDDYLTDAVFPILLHEDPRYYRMGRGAFLRRVSYALSRIAITRTDAGSHRANYSEFLGTAAAQGIANAYYPADSRTLGNTAQRFGTQLASDALFNVLKEFWPDIRGKSPHRSGRVNP
jgi:hypothetical protein